MLGMGDSDSGFLPPQGVEPRWVVSSDQEFVRIRRVQGHFPAVGPDFDVLTCPPFIYLLIAGAVILFPVIVLMVTSELKFGIFGLIAKIDLNLDVGVVLPV